MRFKTLVLNPLSAVLIALIAVSLPVSQIQTSANAPQVEDTVSKPRIIAAYSYIEDREKYLKYKRATRNRVRVALNQKVVTTGVKYIGIKYCHGGTSLRCFDCSGFTQYVFKKRGIDIPRVAQDQYNKARKIRKSRAIKGDLVFFMHGNYVYHVGIYMGDNKVLHAPKPGRRVKIESIWTNHVKFGRI
jgi:cell wall-associated NlpC family hydrolase